MTWKMPVTWEMCAYINVEADTLDEAMEIVRDDADVIPLPLDGANYIDASWNLSSDDEDYLLSLQTPEVVTAHEKQRGIRGDC